MNVRDVRDVDLLYALFLGRLPENNFVRAENLGRSMTELIKVMIGSGEFAQSVVERLLQHNNLPHRSLPLRILPEVLQLVADAPFAPPYHGAAAPDWREVLGRVLAADPFRGFLISSYGDLGSQVIDRLNVDQPVGSAPVGNERTSGVATSATVRSIAGGAEIVADTICRGWIVDCEDPNALLHIRVRLNGQTVRIFAADEFRRDVQVHYGGLGRAGFTIRLDHLSGYPALSRATIEISEVEQGTLVLPERSVECSPLAALSDEVLLRTTLLSVRDCAARLRPEHTAEASGGWALSRAVDFLRARRVGPRPPPADDPLRELMDAVERLEQWLPELRHRQSWALPFYALVRPFVDLVVEPPRVEHPGGFSLLVINAVGSASATAVTLSSLAAQTFPPREILLLAPTRQETPALPKAVTFIPTVPGQPTETVVNNLARRAAGTHLVILDAGVTLAPTALAWLAAAIERGQSLIVYSDGETVAYDPGGREHREPLFRSAFDYDLLLQRNYIGATFCIERDAFVEIGGLSDDVAHDAQYDLLLRVAAKFGGGAFLHVPLVLVTAPVAAPDPNSKQRLLRTVQHHLDRVGSGAHAVAHADGHGRAVPDAASILWPDDPARRISVIVPTRDAVDLVFALVSSLRRHASHWERIEIVVVVNGDFDARARLGFAEIETVFDNVRITHRPVAFNWSEINNTAASEVAGEGILLFLNDDMICLSRGWDSRLAGLLARPEIGVVGGRLLYPNGAIQHAGIAIGDGGMTAHEAMGDPATDGLYRDRTLLVHEVGAVTGAFLACRSALFGELGGFDAQRYAVTSGDADFCVRVRTAGRNVLYDPSQTWIHYESVSRGRDPDDYRKQWRADAEHELWRSSFPEIDLVDLSGNPHLLRSVRPFDVFQRPARDEVELWLAAQLKRQDRPAEISDHRQAYREV